MPKTPCSADEVSSKLELTLGRFRARSAPNSAVSEVGNQPACNLRSTGVGRVCCDVYIAYFLLFCHDLENLSL